MQSNEQPLKYTMGKKSNQECLKLNIQGFIIVKPFEKNILNDEQTGYVIRFCNLKLTFPFSMDVLLS